MKYQKLVRDHIPGIIEASGKIPIISPADEKEYRVKLREKLSEEVAEFLESGKSEELADILEVVYALAQQQGLSVSALEQVRAQKAAERGGFSQRIILKEVKE